MTAAVNPDPPGSFDVGGPWWEVLAKALALALLARYVAVIVYAAVLHSGVVS